MGKKLRFWTGALLGAALQYLYDPQAGPSRRGALREQLGNWMAETKDGLRGGARTQRTFRSPTDLADGVTRAGSPLSAVDVSDGPSTPF
jgi:hypothetical protein